MISFLKKFFCKLNTNKTTKEKDNEDHLSFEFLGRESIRDFQNTLLKSLPTVESAPKSISLLSECGYKATDSKHND